MACSKLVNSIGRKARGERGSALEAHLAENQGIAAQHLPFRADKRPRLAYVSPLPPLRSRIADYSVELLPELARHYDIDVIVAQPTVADAWIHANCPIL